MAGKSHSNAVKLSMVPATNTKFQLFQRTLAKGLFGLFPESLQGLADFYLRPHLAQGFGPLNGQVCRQQFFEKLFAGFEFSQIVETGTFRGTTTEYFAAFGVPVTTVESSKRFFAYSRRRLANLPNVEIHLGDSVAVLRKQIAQGAFEDGITIFYFDAHWEEHLPLKDELELVINNVNEHVILIDDFEVPGDPGYEFDDFGPNKRLSVDYLEAVPTGVDFYVFFPTAPSKEETGGSRGLALVTANSTIAERLKIYTELRFFGSIVANRGGSPRPAAG